MADQPVGAAVDDPVVGLDDDGELEEAAQLVHGPSPQREPDCEHGEPERQRPPTRAGQREGRRAAGSEHARGRARRRTDNVSGTKLRSRPARTAGANRQHELEDRPAAGTQPDSSAAPP